MINQPDSKSCTLDKALFQKLVESDKTTEFKICPKISDIHINVRAHERQRVKYATQLLSKSVSDALLYLYEDEYKLQANAIRLFDDFFDVMNSRTMYDSKSNRCGLGESCYINFKKIIDIKLPLRLQHIATQFLSIH